MKGNRLKNLMKQFILNRLHLLKIEELKLSEEAVKEFETFYNELVLAEKGNFISYDSPFPLYQFLLYLNEKKDIVVHGSNYTMIDTFEPNDSTLFNGKPIKAVFASSDGVWSLFFAVKNRSEYTGSLRNLCLTIPTKKGIKRYYYFSISHDKVEEVWTDGTIYILPKEPFKRGGIADEWVCEQKVKPLAKLSVVPTDFPFINQVSTHVETDSIIKTLLKAFFIKK